MRYSTRTRYGLRFLINLAGRPAGACVQLAEIAREEGVSVKYLEQIVRVLRPAGILRSARGAKGGYALAKSPDAIRMDEVFERLEGHISPVECLHGAKRAANGKASAPQDGSGGSWMITCGCFSRA